MENLPEWQMYLLENGVSIVISLGLAIIGFWLARYIRNKLIRRLSRKRHHQATKLFIVNLSYGLILVLSLIVVLGKLGIPTASLITLLGTSSLAVGLALKDFLSNVTAGAIIVFQRPFEIGDTIEISGTLGVVEKMDLFSVRLKTPHHEIVSIPNGIFVKDRVINKAYQGIRRLELNIGIAYEADINAAKKILTELVQSDKRVLTDPMPIVGISELAESSVNIVVYMWLPQAEFGKVKFELLEKIKTAFDTAKIKIPYPQREVWLKKATQS